jgi:hypothetical protein
MLLVTSVTTLIYIIIFVKYYKRVLLFLISTKIRQSNNVHNFRCKTAAVYVQNCIGNNATTSYELKYCHILNGLKAVVLIRYHTSDGKHDQAFTVNTRMVR